MAMMKRLLTDRMLELEEETGVDLENLMELWSEYLEDCHEIGEKPYWPDFVDSVWSGMYAG